MLGHEVRAWWSFGPSEVEATDSVDPYSFPLFILFCPPFNYSISLSFSMLINLIN